jgi:regulator of protease activity HflC (stomatin/prohibitin superfamily)
MYAKQIIAGIAGFIILVLLVAWFPLTVVRAGQKGVVLRWGAVTGEILDAGIHWVTPVAGAVEKIDIQIQKEEVEASSASKDLQVVTSKVALNYHLNDSQVADLWKNIGSDFKTKLIDPAIQEAVKSATAKYTAEELITKRELVKEDIKTSLKIRLAQDYITVDELNIINFDFSSSFNTAIEAKVTAEQNAFAAKNKLEQVKYEAEQQITTAKAQAQTIKIQAEAINSQGGADYVALKAVEKWNGVLPVQMIPGSAVPFIDLK